MHKHVRVHTVVVLLPLNLRHEDTEGTWRAEERLDTKSTWPYYSLSLSCASIIENKLKDVGFFSPLPLYLSSQKRKTIARRKALVPYLTLLLANNKKYVRKRKQD
jgi:hypothetical protein